MPRLPNETLLALAHPLVALLIAFAFHGAWHFLGRARQMRSFAWAFTCYAVGLTSQILLWPASRASNVLLTGALYGAAAYLFARGIAEQENRDLPWRPALVLLAIMLGLRTWAGAEPGDFLLRTGSLYGAVTVLFLMALWQIRHLARGTALERLLFWFLGLGTLAQLPRVLLTGQARDAAYGYDGTLYWVGTQISFYLFSVGAALLFLLLTAKRTIAEYRHASERDALTGMANRAGLQRGLHRLALSGERYGLAIVDADHFKSINDRHGHPAGDAVLTEMAGVIQAQLRGNDFAARVGGEEFILVMPGATHDAAQAAAQRLRDSLAAHAFSHIAPDLRCTASIGVGSFPAAHPFTQAYACVDQRLIRAKHGGRNRVVSDDRADIGAVPDAAGLPGDGSVGGREPAPQPDR
ncbi:diguanylate cyclase/phosphodiesterase (GGDEF & EAL domains) with PAS/PAC sensor(s) [plant metagenome]|uniref:Diguanylate cyclase/phosphodiesterase (GGDEF & EAL domains) with PAS/PAC sensor(S) n=1 Tax=plant metagenome TaxID=1297885 RepID=A0A484VAW7_9ZZZZ